MSSPAAVLTSPCDSEDAPLGLIVKNTFLCLVSQAPARTLRSASLPPCFRLAESPKQSQEPWNVDDSTDACTEAGALDEDSASSDAGSAARALPLTALTALTAPGPSEPLEPSEAAWEAVGPSPLSAKAAAWQPGSSPVAAVASVFLLEVAAVLAAVQGALVGAGSVRADPIQEPDGWTVRVLVKAADLASLERLLTVAKQALLSAAEKSSCVYVMGYMGSPFIPTPLGFSAMLGEMEDYDQACWDAYGRGCCRRGFACRWGHPSCLARVSVLLDLDEGLGTDTVPAPVNDFKNLI